MFWKSFKNILLLIIVITGGVWIFFSIKNYTPNPSPHSGQTTVDTTAIAEYDPTFGPNDITNMLATAMPTPMFVLTEPDVLSMNAALVGKERFMTSDKITGAEYSTMKIAWYCRKIKVGILDWEWPGSDIGAAKLLVTKHETQSYFSDMDFSVEKGSLTTPVYHSGNGAPYVEQKYNAVLVVNIRKIFINGPIIERGNDQTFRVGDANAGYEIWLLPRTIFTGKSLLQEIQIEVINQAEDLAKLEAIVPGGSNEKLLGMYSDFQKSFTEPGEGHIYNTFITIFGPLARENGFAEIEAIRLVLPPAPRSIYGWMDANDLPLIPSDYPSKYADSTCPLSEPSLEIIDALKNGETNQ